MVAFRASLLIACMLLSTTLNAATLTATVDKKEVVTGEHLLLTLSLANSDTRLRAEGISPNVDLTLLSKDFELGVPREEHRFNISRNRGRATSDLIVELFPRHAGKLVIPSFTIDGSSSTPIHIQVHKKSAETTPEIFTRSDITKNSVWQREQVIAYLDLYHRVELKSAKLGGDIDIEPVQVELHKLPQTERKEKVAGVTYNVVRSAWAITPLLSQSYKFYLPDVWVETIDNKKIRLPIEEKQLRVKTLPGSVPPLAMVGKPVIEQSAITETAVNSVSPWSITIRSPASPASLPDKLPVLDIPAGLKMYGDATVHNIDQQSDVITSVATYRSYIIPLAAGEFTLPEIRLPYFDPDRGIMDVATLKSQTLIAKSALPSQSPATTAINPPITANEPNAATGTQQHSLLWQIISMLVMVLWLLTLGLWWYTRNRAYAKTSELSQTIQPNEHPLKTALLNAFGSRTLEEGLNAWEQQHGIDPEIRNTVRAVQRFSYGKDKTSDENEMNTTVKMAIKKITKSSEKTTPKNPWSPTSFTPS